MECACAFIDKRMLKERKECILSLWRTGDNGLSAAGPFTGRGGLTGDDEERALKEEHWLQHILCVSLCVYVRD